MDTIKSYVTKDGIRFVTRGTNIDWIGRKEKTRGKKPGGLMYGNGCHLYPDCFECPLPDCGCPSYLCLKAGRG